MIETVLGPLPAEELGPTSMHDHVLSDCRMLHRPVAGAPERVTTENAGAVGRAALATADNLVLEDEAGGVAELTRAREAGLSGFVDLTSWGDGGHLSRLPGIARATGLHVVAGWGIYLDRPHPAWVAELDDDELAERVTGVLRDGLPGVPFRAGILGVIGTGSPVTAGEARVVTAVGRAVAATGAPAVVRLDPAERGGERMLERLADAGAAPERIVFPNVDELLEPAEDGAPRIDDLVPLARAGATLELCFGNRFRLRDGFPERGDDERLRGLLALLEQGLEDRIVLGQSTWMKLQLARFGGPGYDHLLARIVPALRERDVPEDTIDRMLVRTPRRLLDRPSDTAPPGAR
jgi:phosphotriesterase-related protein